MNAVERTFAALGIDAGFAWRVLGTVAIFVTWFVVMRIVRRLLARTVDDPASRFSIARMASYVVGPLAIVLVVRLWVQGISGFATYFGLLSAGIAIALQDLITNFAGWVFILVRRPFRIGDRIQIGPHSGDVVDIRPFRFMMLEIGNWVHADQSTGRLLHVPNGWVFKNPVANYSEAFGYIWNELEVVVTFESDWKKAKKALETIAAASAEKLEPDARKKIALAAETLHIQFTKLTPAVWTTVVERGVKLSVRYLCNPRERRSSASAIWEKTLEAFAAMPDVHFAYPTTRFFQKPADDAGVAPDPP